MSLTSKLQKAGLSALDFERETEEATLRLFDAARQGDVESCRWLIAFGVRETYSASTKEETALHIAAGNGHTAICEMLLEAGWNVDARDSWDFSPIHRAAGNGHIDCLDLLVQRGAKPTAASNEGLLPIHLASQAGHAEVVRRLLVLGSPLEAMARNDGPLYHTPLYAACRNGQAEICQILLDAGALPSKLAETKSDPRGSGYLPTYWGESPIHIAAHKGDVTICNLLLSYGAPVNLGRVGNHAETPLHLAVFDGHADVVKLLLDHGASVNSRESPDHSTPLHYANNLEICQLLVDAGADINAVNSENKFPEETARSFSYHEIADFLESIRIRENLSQEGMDDLVSGSALTL